MTDSLHRAATTQLSDWHTENPAQSAIRHTMLAFLAARADACARACVPGHLTGSALVLDHDNTHVLLTLHPRVGRWIQLGGHCENEDGTLVEVALREAREESGVHELVIDPEILHLDTHPVTCSLGVPTRHLDVRFLLHTAPGAEIVRSTESMDLRWWPVDALPPSAQQDTVAELVRLALGRAPAQ